MILSARHVVRAWLSIALGSCSCHAASQLPAPPAPRVFFVQPKLTGIAGNFHVPIAEKAYPTDRPFAIVLWQPNPIRKDGELAPTSWSAGEKTGFYPNAPLEIHQAAFRDRPGETTVQIENDTIGVYLDSRDLPDGSDGGKMMIAPAFKPAREPLVYPFAHGGFSIHSSLELQIPTATDLNKIGNFTYVTSCFVFEDRTTHTDISYNVVLFHHALNKVPIPGKALLDSAVIGPYDAPSHSFQIINSIAPGSPIVTPIVGTTYVQYATWTGWKRFDFAITQDNFAAAIKALGQKAEGFRGSKSVADYGLLEWHLNPELTFASGPASLGWSMRGARIDLVPDKSVGKVPAPQPPG